MWCGEIGTIHPYGICYDSNRLFTYGVSLSLVYEVPIDIGIDSTERYLYMFKDENVISHMV